MPIVSEQVLKANLKNKNILSTYMIFGEDTYLKKLYVDKLISATVDKDDEFNFMKFESECSLQEVYDAKEQYPMMAEKKCVLLTDYDFENCQKSDFEKLTELLSTPTDTTVFILWCNNLSVDEKRSDKLKKLVAATERGGGMAVSLNHRTREELVRVLNDGAKKRGAEFAQGAAAYLIETSSEDITVLLSELEKLCAYVGGGTITRATVDLICVKSVDASVYNLTGDIINLNAAASLKMLSNLYDMRVEPMIILHTIASNFIDIYRAMAARDCRESINSVSEEFGYGNRKFVLEKASRLIDKFTAKKIQLCLNELVSADKRLKSFSVNDRVVLEELILRLIYVISKGESVD